MKKVAVSWEWGECGMVSVEKDAIVSQEGYHGGKGTADINIWIKHAIPYLSYYLFLKCFWFILQCSFRRALVTFPSLRHRRSLWTSGVFLLYDMHILSFASILLHPRATPHLADLFADGCATSPQAISLAAACSNQLLSRTSMGQRMSQSRPRFKLSLSSSTKLDVAWTIFSAFAP